MQKLQDIIKQLESTSKKNEKLFILQNNSDNHNLRLFFEVCLGNHLFYIKKFPSVTAGTKDTIDMGQLWIDCLSKLVSRKVTGNAAIDLLTNEVCKYNAECQDIIRRIIAKTPDCGVSESTVNKVWKDLIPKWPCLLASSYNEKLLDKFDWKRGVFVQDKMDGMRANKFKSGGLLNFTEIYTRSGKTLTTHGVFADPKFDKEDNFMFDGEIVCVDANGELLDRKTSNGICNKAIKGTITKEEAETMHLYAWDILDANSVSTEKSKWSKVPYEERFEFLKKILDKYNFRNVHLVETTIVHSIEEVRELYRQAIEAGKEGVIIKDRDMLWEDKRSKKQMKFKEELDIDLRVTEIIEGTGKYVGMVGSFKVESDCGMIKASVGSGLSDKQRKEFFDNPQSIIDTIIEMKYNAIISNKGKNNHYSLFLPIFVEPRPDKTETTTLKEVL